MPGTTLPPARLLLLLLFLPSAFVAAQPLPDDLPIDAPAPDTFRVRFETTKGPFVVEARRAWSPLGVDRFYHLARAGYYDGVVIFRVGETSSTPGGRVAQFGLHNDAAVNAAWADAGIPDEPVRHTNARGTVIFARAGPRTRTTQLAFNLTHNPGLDSVAYEGIVGFSPIAEVVEGLEVWDAFYAAHGNAPAARQDSIAAHGRAYLDRAFPGLDRILRVEVVDAP